MTTKEAAIAYLDAGLSVIPTDKPTKKPKVPTWAAFQQVAASKEQAESWFQNGAALAVIGGVVSGNLEVIDFDKPGAAKEWAALLKSWNCGAILEKLVIERSQRGGTHAAYRWQGQPEGNQKLALAPDKTVKIETRGEGGYCLVAPTDGYILKQGDWTKLPLLTAEEREALLAAARYFDESPKVYASRDQGRVGDDYNARADLAEIVSPLGWTKAPNKDLWVRPGKTLAQGYSASWNHQGNQHFVVFTTSAGVEAGAYDLFGLYARLHHGGDFKAAAIAAGKSGYGSDSRQVAQKKAGILPELKMTEDGLIEGVTFDNATFEPTEIVHLWDPRLPFGKQVLWDADGGTGKTSLLAAIAAGFSVGQLPCGDGPCDIVKTAYFHKGEDDTNEIATVFRANGGDLSQITFFDRPDFNLDPEGLDALARTLDKGGYRFVVFDALIYFCQHLQREGWKDPMAILPSLQGLARVARETGAQISNIRHTTKGIVGKAASELGFGSVQFRNSHRGQLVMRYHPTEKGLIIVTDEKGSLLTPRGDAFAFRRKGPEIEYVAEFDNPFDAKDTFEARAATKAFAKDWIARELSAGPKPAREVITAGEQMGLHKRTIQRALSELGGHTIRHGFGSGSQMLWSLTAQVPIWWAKDDAADPYAD